MCHKLYKKDMELMTLTTTNPLTQVTNRKAIREEIEKYWNTDGDVVTKVLEVYE